MLKYPKTKFIVDRHPHVIENHSPVFQTPKSSSSKPSETEIRCPGASTISLKAPQAQAPPLSIDVARAPEKRRPRAAPRATSGTSGAKGGAWGWEMEDLPVLVFVFFFGKKKRKHMEGIEKSEEEPNQEPKQECVSCCFRKAQTVMPVSWSFWAPCLFAASGCSSPKRRPIQIQVMFLRMWKNVAPLMNIFNKSTYYSTGTSKSLLDQSWTMTSCRPIGMWCDTIPHTC